MILDEHLLRAVNGEARRSRVNRSHVIREALREHLRRRRIRALEEQHPRSYERRPVGEDEFAAWDRVAAWPEE